MYRAGAQWALWIRCRAKDNQEPLALPCIFEGGTTGQSGELDVHKPHSRRWVSRAYEFRGSSLPPLQPPPIKRHLPTPQLAAALRAREEGAALPPVVSQSPPPLSLSVYGQELLINLARQTLPPWKASRIITRKQPTPAFCILENPSPSLCRETWGRSSPACSLSW